MGGPRGEVLHPSARVRKAPEKEGRNGGVTVIGVKPPGEEFVYPNDKTWISADDLLIVSGHADLLERFAARP